jgi:hypothetical protein
MHIKNTISKRAYITYIVERYLRTMASLVVSKPPSSSGWYVPEAFRIPKARSRCPRVFGF